MLAGLVAAVACIVGRLLQVVGAQVAPRLAPLTRELEFRRGERFQLVCSCREGEPPLSFSWLWDGQTLVESAEVVVRRFDEFSSSITVSALREEHAGNYTCIVSNRGGSDSSTTRLKVLVTPTWLRQPYDLSALSGSRVSLNCETSGVPKPTVTWRRSRGFNLERMESLSVTHWRTGENGSLTTSAVKKEDEGFYSCEVANGVGEGLRKTVRIEVQVPPSVQMSSAEVTSRKGDSAVVQCLASGDLPLTVSWAKANRNLPLVSEDRIKIQEESSQDNTTSSVVIRNTAAEDTGLYVCSARNSYGQSQAVARLNVVEQPSTPLEFRVSEVWCKSVRLQWKQPYNGNSPLRYYLIRYKVKNSKSGATESRVPDSQSSVVIRDLRSRTTYSFQMVAVNDVGASGASSTQHATTREEEPEAAPQNVHVKSKDSSGFLLSWKAPPPDKWNGVLTGFLIGYKKVSQNSAHSTPFTYLVVREQMSAGDERPREHRVSGLQESSSYTVVVRATNGEGMGPPSAPVVVKTSYGEPPGVPILTLMATEQTLVALRVELKEEGKSKPPATQYTLHVREGSGHWIKIPLHPDSPDHRVGGLVAGALYKMYVTARSGNVDSEPSEVLTFKTEPESSVFQYEEEDMVAPFYQRLSFIIPVCVSSTIICVVPLAACCCLRKLSDLQARPRTEGVESRGFTYTASGSGGAAAGGRRSGGPRPRSLPPVPSSSRDRGETSSSGHYSTLQNYGSVIPAGDPRFGQFVTNNKLLGRHVVELPDV